MSEHLIELALQEVPDEPPREFKILSRGVNKTRKGDIVFDDQAARDVVREYEAHGADLFIDYKHDFGEAAGWFKPTIRNGELWATDVRWTETAQQKLRERAWRYFSPAVVHDTKTNRVARLLNVALTNIPAMAGLRPLVAAEEINMADDIKAPAPAAEGATEDSVLLKALGAKTLSEGIGRIEALKASHAENGQLKTKLAEVEAVQTRAQVTQMLDEAVAKGAIREGQKASLLQGGLRDPEWLRGFLAECTPSPHARPETKTPDQAPAGAAAGHAQLNLSAADLASAELFNLTPEQYAAEKARFTAGKS